MDYIYSARARSCIPTSIVTGLSIKCCDPIDYPTWFEEDNPGCKIDEFPYMIHIYTNPKSGITHMNYGYYVDDMSQVVQDMRILAKLIWSGEEI